MVLSAAEANMEGQYLFGLRREEALKFTLSEAYTKKDFITLTPSWTKGGIGRDIPITNSAQYSWLERVKKAVEPGQALIEKDNTYAKQSLTNMPIKVA